MLDFLRQRSAVRKLRLALVAIAGHVADLAPDEVYREALRIAEAFADGRASEDELRGVGEAAREAALRLERLGLPPGRLRLLGPLDAGGTAAFACTYAAMPDEVLLRNSNPASACVGAVCRVAWSEETARTGRADESHGPDGLGFRLAERARLIPLIREVAGDPFRPVATDPAWLTPNVVALARTAYDHRDFGVLPVLADALEDAGCGVADLLAHLRGPGPHVRGCWALDVVLGRA